MASISKALKFMLRVANDDTHGYDQQHRNGPDYDCSSLVGTALHEAGFKVSPYSWTGNLFSQLVDSGFEVCTKPYRAGDIHLKVGKHVCMSVDSNTIVHASINEKGKAKGGKTGDQTGREICTRSYYEYAGGWDYHLRFNGKDDETETLISTETIAREVIAGRWGNGSSRTKKLTEAGYNAKEVQLMVNKILMGTKNKTYEEVAREVINGKWGNGKNRKLRLESAGFNYATVQRLVNAILKEV